MSCINKLTANISYDCSPQLKAKAGLETKAVFINKSDIDLTALTESGATVSNISLVSGATGFSVEWVKQLSNTASEFASNDSGADSFTHSFAGRVFGQSAADFERIRELKDGEFVIIVETKYKGALNADAYKVFGLESGLKMSEGTFTSLENDGAFLFTLSSAEGFGESYPAKVWKETSYATTKAKFDALLAE